jgi:hypothetical protein
VSYRAFLQLFAYRNWEFTVLKAKSKARFAALSDLSTRTVAGLTNREAASAYGSGLLILLEHGETEKCDRDNTNVATG